VQRQVFDPFFTTRRAEGHTGLGLYIVHNLVTEQLGGRITLISAPGMGTTIRMTLPLLAPGPVKVEQPSRVAQDRPDGGVAPGLRAAGSPGE
jgi:nitrogen-specific signal transduction histidine kinase